MPTTPEAFRDRVRHLPVPDTAADGGDLVSVVVPARDEDRNIGICLDAIRAQSHRNLQILVVDGGSVDQTVDVVRQHAADDPRIELLHNSRHLIAVSLNMAVAHARGRWLIRVDAHSTVGPEYVALAVSLLRDGHWGGVGGRKDGAGTTCAGRAIAAAMASKFGVGSSIYHHGTFSQPVDHIPFGAYPVDLVRKLGGWDERLLANEDFEFDLRVRRSGRPLLFDPRIVIRWQSRQSVRDLFRQYRRYGRGKADVAVLHPDSLSPRHVLPPAFVAYCAFACAAALRRPAHGMAMVAPYLVALTTATAVTGRELATLRERVWVAPAFLAMHVGWGLGFWSGLTRTVVGSAAPRRGR